MSKEKKLLNAVLVFLVKPRTVNGGQKVADEVLLAMKTGKIGAGCWNGYGGGIEAGETSEMAAVREFSEESGGTPILAEALIKMAVADFHNTYEDKTSFVCRVHIFLAEKWSGEPTSTEMMVDPTWFKRIDGLPFDKLMPADRFWLPAVLIYRPIFINASYGPRQKELIGPVNIKPSNGF